MTRHPFAALRVASVQHVYPTTLEAAARAKRDRGVIVASPLIACVLCKIDACEQVLFGGAVCHQSITPERAIHSNRLEVGAS